MEIREAPIFMYLIQKPFLVYLFNLFFFFFKFVKLGHLSMNWKQIKESRKVFLIYVVCYKLYVIVGIMVYCMTTNVCMLFTISSEG